MQCFKYSICFDYIKEDVSIEVREKKFHLGNRKMNSTYQYCLNNLLSEIEDMSYKIKPVLHTRQLQVTIATNGRSVLIRHIAVI